MPDPSATQPAILFANDAYYAAFADGDPAAMDALWARRAPVSCIHPGQTALTDRAAIMASWRIKSVFNIILLAETNQA